MTIDSIELDTAQKLKFGSNMRPWRGDRFSHLRYARHVSIASIICMATAPCFWLFNEIDDGLIVEVEHYL